MGGIDYRILGSLEASRDGRHLPLGGRKQRTVLAILLLRANRVVTKDELIEALWSGKTPGRPETAIQGYISKLRKAIEPDHPFEVIITEPTGYRLPVERGGLDLARLELLLRRGRDTLEASRADVASRTFSDALALFRGPPLADFTYESWAQVEIGRLDDLRLTCLEGRIDADLRLGRHSELVGEIEAVIANHPFRERPRAHLILALYRAGRQSEALAAYQEARRVLVDEFGIEPTRALQELERKVLLQDPSLDLEPAGPLGESAGELTLLFTDIEGSTRLVHRLGDDYAHVLLEHRRLLREALESKNGRIVDNYGDCFFATFQSPAQAADAAATAQRALADYPWPGLMTVRARMGVHTGTPVAVGDGFVGLDVHRASRICDAAHGGEIFLSQRTVELLADEPLEAMEIRDLGEHVLRGLPQPERLFQLIVAGLPDVFPPPRSERDSKTPVSDRSLLIVPHTGLATRQLVDIGAPLARSWVPHELIVARLIEVAGIGAQDLDDSLALATADLHDLRSSLVERGVATRVAAFTSTAIGEDTVRLASEQAVDLVLLGCDPDQLDGTLDPQLVTVFTNALCDVAVCPLRQRSLGDNSFVLVPFGGSAHDWAAVELGAWMASASGYRLRLVGVMRDPATGRRDASRLLAAASLSVQQLVGVPTEPSLAPTGETGLLHAAEGAAAVVVGIPDNWRERGLGSVRTELALAAGPTTLFVRRGMRPGGIAPRDSLTRYTWSLADHRTAS